MPTVMRRRTHVAKKGQPTIHVDFDASGELEAFVFRLQQSFTPRFLGDLIKRAAAETILQAIRRDFLQRLPQALEMIVVHDTMGEVTNLRHRDIEERKTWSRLHDDLAQAQLSGDGGKIVAAQKSILEFRQKFLNALNRDRKSNEHTPTWSKLSSGKFRARALDVLDQLTNMDHVQVIASGSDVMVSWGNIAELDKIKTPSAIQYVFHRGPTRSPYNILWRHLEFGTGFYAKDPEGAHHPNRPLPPSAHDKFREGFGAGGYWRLPTGKWPRPYSNSILLKGSKGVHALKDVSGVMYDASAVQFGARLAMALYKSLDGQTELKVA